MNNTHKNMKYFISTRAEDEPVFVTRPGQFPFQPGPAQPSPAFTQPIAKTSCLIYRSTSVVTSE